ncbi:MAG: DUF4012 domain-containing protein [Patescibacteria group bacterium]
MPKQQIIKAIFDIRPINPATKKVDFEFIEKLKPEVNLKPQKQKIVLTEIPYSKILPVKAEAKSNFKDEILVELQENLSKNIDLKEELSLFGGRLVSSNLNLKPKPVLDLKNNSDFDFSPSENIEQFRNEFAKIFSNQEFKAPIALPTKSITPPPYLPWGPEIINSLKTAEVINLSPVARNIDIALEEFKRGYFDSDIEENSASYILEAAEKKASKTLIYFTLGLFIFFGLTLFSVGTFNLKDRILQKSNQAYINLNLAQENLSQFNFFEAASSFALAARNFELLNEDLKKANSVFSVLDKVTLGGTSDVSSLLKAGGLISGAAVSLFEALGKLSEANLISLVYSHTDSSSSNILTILFEFRLNLIQASRNLNEAKALIANSDTNLISESEIQKFEEFRKKLPEFNKFVDKSIRYSEALMAILGQAGSQRYIILFQNSSELRPTGGFPGSYALVEFNKGVMGKFVVDDIYNPDGQMKEKIIPPKPLQKITPNWGMRDANWFVDFQSSAKKTAEFYYKDTGILVDGVLAVNVDLIPEILKITGPLEMADFGLTLDSENFIKEVQKEVEYQRTKSDGRPKQILVEFAPKFLDKLSNLDKEGWVRIFAILVSGLERKDILGYFAEPRLQNFALENGFAGEIKQTSSDSDYLMAVHSNIMGSKTDAVIDNSMILKIESGELNNFIHTLEITRNHKGGDLGFYKKRNNDYVRVLLPEDVEIIQVSGNDSLEINPLIDYKTQGFTSDPDLERYESKAEKSGNIEIFQEGGKKAIAFWMIIEPGEAKKVVLTYKTPAYKNIYFQKQPGAKSSLKVILNGRILFDAGFFSDQNIGLE